MIVKHFVTDTELTNGSIWYSSSRTIYWILNENVSHV